MKFGRKFHLYRVPAWESHYLPYKHLKALLKLATTQAFQSNMEPNFTEFYAWLRRGIAASDAFFHGRCAFLRCKEESIDERYSPTVLGFRCPRLDLVDRLDLEDISAIFAELQDDYLELQWFSRVNQEATLRICAKLEKVAQVFGHPRQEEMTRHLEEQHNREKLCLKQIQRLQALINDVSRVYQLPRSDILSKGPSVCLKALYDKVPEAYPYLNAINGYIRTDQASDLANMLEKMPVILNTFPIQFQSLFYSLLALSVSSRAWACARILLAEELPQKGVLVDHNCLNLLIGVIGRSRQRNRGGIYEDNQPESVDPTLEETGASLFLQMLEHLGSRSEDVLQAKDAVGRLPLHYGAIYSLTTICQSILNQFSHDQHRDTSAARKVLLTADNEGFTPLHWSVICGHLEITQLFLTALDTDVQTINDALDQYLGATLSSLLLIALKYQDDDMVRLLASSRINVSHKSSSGETGLYVAAQLGREDYVNMLLKTASHQNASIDVPETAYGWTPLFIACVEGHLPVVELLLQAGADEYLVDSLGWTAKEHAAFRGHLPTAERLRMSKTVGATGGPGQTHWNGKMTPKYRLRHGCTYIVVNLGVMQKGKQIKPVDFNCFLPGLDRAQPDTTLSLEVSTPTGNNVSHLLRLPLLDDLVDNTFVFSIEDPSEARLNFKLFRADSTHRQKSTVVGGGTALLQDDRKCFGAQRESLIREHSVPILEKETMDFLGTVTFTFVLAGPFPYLNTPTLSISSLEKSESVQLVGHRGLGQNLGSHEYLQLGENTVESFLSAAKLGASHVEFDIQLTRDLVPVLYHDFSLSESGTDVPIHDLTLKQFMYASNIQSPRGDPVSVLGTEKPQTALRDPDRHKPRSRSLTQSQEKGAKEVQDRMKHTVDFADKGFKPNSRGDFIQDSFATLEEALHKVPESIGFDMEIKYPRIHEAFGAGVAPVTIDLNTFIDTILTIISRFAGARSIILSSFTPEVCILLALKQKAYPVLFITNAGKRPIADKEQRTGSLQVAVRFASQWGLVGVMFASDAFVMCPRLVGYVKKKGLVCGSYGASNNVPERVELQVKSGIQLIVADRVGLISKTLKGLPLQHSS